MMEKVNERGAGRKPLEIKKVPVIFYIYSDRVDKFKGEVIPVANRINGAGKVEEAISNLDALVYKKAEKGKILSGEKSGSTADWAHPDATPPEFIYP